MNNIEPLEVLSARIHTTSSTDIMPGQIHRDLMYYMSGSQAHSRTNMRALQTLRNAVISRSAPVFIEMATFVLTTQTIKPKKSMNKLNNIAVILCAAATLCLLVMVMLQASRIERLEEKVLQIQQSVGYYEDSTP